MFGNGVHPDNCNKIKIIQTKGGKEMKEKYQSEISSVNSNLPVCRILFSYHIRGKYLVKVGVDDENKNFKNIGELRVLITPGLMK